MQHFKDTLKHEDGRYQVTWPWKRDIDELPENRGLAVGRLKSLVTRIEKQPELKQKYDDVIQDQLQKGVIERVDKNTEDGYKHYIPHHVVITPTKSTTKLRVVYDASAKTRSDNKSLNECLYRGPVKLHDLCGILMRFRLNKIGIVADIEKAFLQVGLQPLERDVTRFLWLKDINKSVIQEENIQEFRFARVPFGVISSPFLLGATIECHLDSYESEIAGKLKNDIYVDNVITGTKTETEAVQFYKLSKSIFRDASMNLREWITNSKCVNASIPSEDRSECERTKVLGHYWNVKDDTLSLKAPTMLPETSQTTKRTVLKQIASVYDPLGLFCPILLRGKVLLQSLWTKHCDWDDQLEDLDIQSWKSIKEDFENISNYEIPRYVGLQNENAIVRNKLICFCDASKYAYACCIYLVQRDENESKVNLVFAKSRLAPVKQKMTIARLELMAMVIGVRCIGFVKKELKLEIDETYLFTDSQCALKWTVSDKALPVFVKNRVKEIKSHSECVLGYVSTKENPADVASRGMSMDQLQNNQLWWDGPDWLSKPTNEWNIDEKLLTVLSKTENIEQGVETNEAELMLHSKDASELGSDINSPCGINCEKYSSAIKLFRVTALVLRFIKRTRKQKYNSKSISSEELVHAENLWLLHTQKENYPDVHESIKTGKKCSLKQQLGVFIDENGLLRCKGRLENADISDAARYPILLPKKGHITRLLIERTHKQQMHSGLSQTLSAVRFIFWIPSGRATVRSVLRQCLMCRKTEGGAYKMPPMPPFPKGRVTEAVAFERTGLDYLGPLYIRTSGEYRKVWVCLFTCLVTRAVHLETVHDMSAEEFLLALRRFIAQRGSPNEINSDNAKQLKLASDAIELIWRNTLKSDDVQTYIANHEIKWNFIVERAPWYGGYWERLVGLVKRALRKTLGRKSLTGIQLQTVIKEIESVINSRPLLYVDDDINSNITLTPGHFLTLNPRTGIPGTDYDENDPEYEPYESSAKKLLKLWNKGQRLVNNFWEIWKKEYLISLRERTQTELKTARIKSEFKPSVGDVVLVKDDVPRGCWKLGRIKTLVKSNDGHCRSAKVSMSNGRILGRTLNLLYPIEVTGSAAGDEPKTVSPKGSDDRVSRPKRRAAIEAAKNIKRSLKQ